MDNGYLLTSDLFSNALAGSSIQSIWEKSPYHFFKISGSHWVVVTDVQNPNGLERDGKEHFFWLGNKDAVLELLSAHPGIITFQAQTFPGPSLLERKERVLSIRTSLGFQAQLHLDNQKEITISIPVSGGLNQIMMRDLDVPSLTRLPHGDTRTLLLQIRSWRITDFKREEKQ